MNAYVVSADRRLLEAMRGSGHFDTVVSVSKEMAGVLISEAEERSRIPSASDNGQLTFDPGMHTKLNTLEADGLPVFDRNAARVWLVSDTQLDIYEAMALGSGEPHSRIVYMLSNGLDPQALKTRQSLCAAHGLSYTLPYHTAEQVADIAAGVGASRDKPLSKVITGIAALPQLGLTSSLLRTGITLSRMSGIRVGILGLNGWNPGDSGIRYTGKYLDELWGSLQGRQLQAHELKGKMHQLAPGAHYLAGSRDLKKLYYYNIEGTSWLIDKAKECFDLLLIDAGSYPDHALAAQSILASDLLLVQMHQHPQAKLQWGRLCDHILQPVFRWEERQSLLLFNQMHRSPEMETEKQLSRQLGLPYVGSLPFVQGFSRAEAEESLLERQWPDYDKELAKACRALLHFYDIPLLPSASASSMEGKAHELEVSSKSSSWLRWMKPVKGA
ncbi:hypothetical protein [Paenibacillus rigui]|uniref:hypothetical protein n=1 Tax=Paenibacillus rigui TaxID=554312 RepID=UPI00117FC3B7|nr:hypothetical protein [Paenibacillus rigui]